MNLVPLPEPECHSHPVRLGPHESELDFHTSLRTFSAQQTLPPHAPTPIPLYIWSLGGGRPMGSTSEAFHLYCRGHRTAILWWNQAVLALKNGTPGAKGALSRAAWVWAQLATFVLPLWPPACRTVWPGGEVPEELFPAPSAVWAWTARSLAQDQVLIDPTLTLEPGLKARIAYASLLDAQRALQDGTGIHPKAVRELLVRRVPHWTQTAGVFWAMAMLKEDDFEERFPLLLATLTRAKDDHLRGCPIEDLNQARNLVNSLNRTTYLVDLTRLRVDHGVGPFHYIGTPAYLLKFTRKKLETSLQGL